MLTYVRTRQSLYSSLFFILLEVINIAVLELERIVFVKVPHFRNELLSMLFLRVLPKALFGGELVKILPVAEPLD